MAVFIKPVNKTLVVEREPTPENKNEFGILVPDSVKSIGVSTSCVVKLVACEEKSPYEKYEGQKLLVRTSMIEDVDIKGAKGSFISENGVIAVIAESGIL